MNGPRAGQGVFPLPSLGSPPPLPVSRSRRVRQRHNRAAARHHVASRATDAVNYLSSSFAFTSTFDSDILFCASSSPLSSSSPLPTQARNQPINNITTQQQRRVQNLLLESADRFVRRRGSVNAASGDDWAWSDTLPVSANINLSGAARAAGIVPLVADRVALPSSSQCVPLLNLLPPDLRDLYSSPDRLLLPAADEGPARAPGLRAKCFGSASEYSKLVRRLHSLGMVEYSTVVPKAVNGLFGVPKDGDSIRLIIDARPANLLFKPTPKLELPTPDLLSELCVDPTRPLYVAKVDMSNMFHHLELPSSLRPYFGLPPLFAGDLDPATAQRYGLNTRVYPCCTRLPMGWSHSPYLAQQVHEHLLNTRTSLRASDRITSSTDRFVDRTRHAVYLDDLNLLGHDRRHVSQLQEEYLGAVMHSGLLVKWSKVVYPSADGVEVIGMEVDGHDHTIGLSAPKLAALVTETKTMLRRGYATGLELARLVGKWTWAMLARRPALAAFNAVYRFSQVAGARLFTLWPTVRRELQVAECLAPLLWCSLRHDWFPDVLATDASTSGLGVVAIAADVDDVADAAAEPVTLPLPDQEPRVHPSLRPILESRSRVIVSAHWRDQEHINVLELRAVHTALRWAASRPAGLDCRLMLLVDSAVCVYALNKGRSSSRPMLRRLRSIAALVLASGLRVITRWIPSNSNPADEPSRRPRPECLIRRNVT